MGGQQGKHTPLEGMLRNFKKGFEGDYSVELNLEKLWMH